MEIFFLKIVQYVTFLVFTLCIIGTIINLFKCISKYSKINKTLTLHKKNNISSEDIKSLTEKEYYLWIYKFLIKENYIDSKDFTYTNNLQVNIKNSIVTTKNNLPIFIKIIRTQDDSHITLKKCREFLGEMLYKKCSVGILVCNHAFSKECKTFLNTVPSDFKIIYLNDSEIIEFYNKIYDFPTSLA
ncbi:restriction endonuclease [Oceanirhabdus sp. W0125-5]|uniref:restriction endonuclease n=1 Tax=Oceanirhabdus sp. W0125-5 TaxID=2999116 RepID=UPI0022F2AC12|nr:hypothetical protein [Oceanirhabdus sp. W0125-5]WBW99220.1 hypothetical protein OW730_10860 [Oceanirhabdus sp. W0125-5]